MPPGRTCPLDLALGSASTVPTAFPHSPKNRGTQCLHTLFGSSLLPLRGCFPQDCQFCGCFEAPGELKDMAEQQDFGETQVRGCTMCRQGVQVSELNAIGVFIYGVVRHPCCWAASGALRWQRSHSQPGTEPLSCLPGAGLSRVSSVRPSSVLPPGVLCPCQGPQQNIDLDLE